MVGISVDSLDETICFKIGRHSGKKYLSKERLEEIVSEIKAHKIRLKFNTVVSPYNYKTNIAEQLQAYKPDRLKILRQLPFNGEKGISDEHFEDFFRINKEFTNQKNVVIEDKNEMTQSYLMIDPSGRFFQNGNGQEYYYSDPIYEVGLEKALSQISFSKEKYMSRYKT